VVLLVCTLAIPWLGLVLGTEPLAGNAWGLVLTCSCIPLAFGFGAKAVQRRIAGRSA
jgi:hypothetical protein